MATSFPTTIQTFITMLNVDANDGALIGSYQTAMQAGNVALAQTYYNQITNANQKFINANTLNTLMDTCVALENFYKTDIQPYVTTKQSEWQGIIDQFSYQGVYSATVQYEQNNFVLYNVSGQTYVFICIATPPTTNIIPTNTTYWRQLTIQGQKGDSGNTLSFLYEWNSTTPYSLQDLVTHNNALWGCILANTNQTPQSGSSYWQLVGAIGQAIYPFQMGTPTTQNVGELWLQIL
jgi:hypothetical protein